jgi:hypothetical protein
LKTVTVAKMVAQGDNVEKTPSLRAMLTPRGIGPE